MKFLLIAALLLLLVCSSHSVCLSEGQTRELPLSYGIIIDNSTELRTKSAEVKAAAIEIINSNVAADETFIFFSHPNEDIGVYPELRRGKLSGNKTELLGFLDKLKFDSRKKPILDEMYLSADFLNNSKDTGEYRRALVLLTDGKDKGSYYQQKQVFSLFKTRLPVFTLLITSKAENKSVRFAQAIAAMSGGKVFVVDEIEEIEDSTKALINELRKQ